MGKCSHCSSSKVIISFFLRFLSLQFLSLQMVKGYASVENGMQISILLG